MPRGVHSGFGLPPSPQSLGHKCQSAEPVLGAQEGRSSRWHQAVGLWNQVHSMGHQRTHSPLPSPDPACLPAHFRLPCPSPVGPRKDMQEVLCLTCILLPLPLQIAALGFIFLHKLQISPIIIYQSCSSLPRGPGGRRSTQPECPRVWRQWACGRQREPGKGILGNY